MLEFNDGLAEDGRAAQLRRAGGVSELHPAEVHDRLRKLPGDLQGALASGLRADDPVS